MGDDGKTVRVDGALMTSREAAHDQLAARLSLPERYGRNLDALYDCLSELCGVRIVVEHAGGLEALGGYGELLLRVLREAAEANPGLDVTVRAD